MSQMDEYLGDRCRETRMNSRKAEGEDLQETGSMQSPWRLVIPRVRCWPPGGSLGHVGVHVKKGLELA